MKITKTAKNIAALLVVSCNVGCDQLTKTIVREHVAYFEKIPLAGKYFTLTKIENSGAFLSFGDNLPDIVRLVLFSLLPLMVIAFGIYFLLNKPNQPPLLILGASFIIGGGLGNLYDRLVHGSVTDFLHMDFGIFQTGIFNMADVSIMTGMLLLLFHFYRPMPQKTT